jgi:DNA-binding IscR family transcriptional regulator
MWSGLYKTITDYLEGITLQDLLDRANTSAGNDYVI